MHGGPNGGRRSPLSRAFLSDVFQDFLDGCGLGDEGKDLHLGPTAPTGQWVDFIDAVDELGPALGEGAPGWRGVGCIVGRSAIPCPVGGATLRANMLETLRPLKLVWKAEEDHE